ncbi:MAG: AAA family ATPase [Candidatus Thermoplasmatota archaeon]|nr:AAA family ATPase [Candidatus Thermoplasmatota archaeon]
MRIIGVCGMPGSGKGEIAEVASNMGANVHSMGDVVRSYFTLHCTDRDPVETGIYADMERKKYGEDIWARRLIETIEHSLRPDTELVMIDGLRSTMEATLFKSRWEKHFIVLAVHSSPDIRFQRLSERGRGDDTKNRKKFRERDERELGWGLGEVIARADIMMVNEKGKDTFHQRINDLFKHLEEEP